MDNEILIALLGIIGTLGGTILGWFLNTLSQKGKLNVFITSWKDEFKYNKVGTMVSSSSMEQTSYYTYNLSLDLYNSSGEIKIMRNVNICFYSDKKELLKSIPKDDSTRRTNARLDMVFYDELFSINIPAKSVFHIELHNTFWNNKENSLDFIWKTNKVVLIYTNEKNKQKEVLINKEEYKNYFQNHLVVK